MLISRHHFQPFEDAWDKMLVDHGITPPLHMKEFGRPHGRFASISDSARRALFSEAVNLINQHKVGSLSCSISNADYHQHFSKEAREKFNVYGMCFLLTVVMNHGLADHNSYKEKIPFIMDSGNPYASQVRESHAYIIKELQNDASLHLGSLTFAEDTDFGILQAADVISWAARRRATKITLGDAFSPIEDIFKDEMKHLEASWRPEWIKQTWDRILKRIEAKTS
jgi:hypothetical protein